MNDLDFTADPDALHEEAEFLADVARRTEDQKEAERLRKKATSLVKRAARLREENE